MQCHSCSIAKICKVWEQIQLQQPNIELEVKNCSYCPDCADGPPISFPRNFNDDLLEVDVSKSLDKLCSKQEDQTNTSRFSVVPVPVEGSDESQATCAVCGAVVTEVKTCTKCGKVLCDGHTVDDVGTGNPYCEECWESND